MVKLRLWVYAVGAPALLAMNVASCGGDDNNAQGAPDGSEDQTSEQAIVPGHDSSPDSQTDATLEGGHEAGTADADATVPDGPPSDVTLPEGGPDVSPPDAQEASADARTPLDAPADSIPDVAIDSGADAGGADADAGAPDADAGAPDGDAGAPDADAAACSVSLPTANAFFATMVSTFCEQRRNACNLSPSQFNQSKCLSIFSGTSVAGLFGGVGAISSHLDAGTLALDPVAACQCLTRLPMVPMAGTATQADYDSLQAACNGALAGTVMTGQACSSSYDCTNGNYCAPVNDAGQCAALVSDGGSCAAVFPSAEPVDFACSFRALPSPEMYCDLTSNTCVPRIPTGSSASCPRSPACQSNACVRPSDAGTCVEQRSITSSPLCNLLTQPDAGDGG
jgi:hypothetical protein